MLRIIVNCGPCENYIAQCLESLQAQSLRDWRAYVTVDPCGDRTYETAARVGAGDSRVHVHQNCDRRYSMVNLMNAVGRSGAAPDDVIVILDGDDWLATPEALTIIDAAYREAEVWMTYGSWVADRDDLENERCGRWPAYAADTVDFRHSPWLGTAVRTWKRWLWDLIDDRDFRDAAGNYFRVTEDQAVMMPMLEMSGVQRARHIQQPLMVYNRSSPWACGLTRCDEMLGNSSYIRTLPPYPLLPESPGSEAAVQALRLRRSHHLSSPEANSSAAFLRSPEAEAPPLESVPA